MQDLKNKPAKKAPKQYVNQNPIEAITNIGSGIRDSFKEDLAKGAVNEAWDELLGKKHEKQTKGHEQSIMDHGDLSEGAEIDFTQGTEAKVEITEMGREFSSEVLNAGKKASAELGQETQVRMQEILIEIKKISESSTELKEQVDVISMEQSMQDPNIYSLNFFDQVLSFVRDFRLKVDDSLAWFKALRSKNAAKQYGSMAKKHGTSFTLSNERQVATQAG